MCVCVVFCLKNKFEIHKTASQNLGYDESSLRNLGELTITPLLQKGNNCEFKAYVIYKAKSEYLKQFEKNSFDKSLKNLL